jgi:hypothetical protein
MQRICKLIAVIFAFFAGTASGLEKASAQDATNPGDYPVLRHALSVARECTRDDIDAAGA